MTLEAQTQFNALADRLSAAKAAQKAALVALGRTPTDVWDTYPDELRAVTGGTGNYQESKTVTADPAGMTITPDEGYSGMLKAIIAAEPNFQPWNLVDGIQAWGITGTAKPAVSTDPPTNLPVDKDDADTAYEGQTGAAPAETDYFVCADNNGNITYWYLSDDFTITSYDPITTEFKATGAIRMAYHTTGEQAGTWAYDDFTDTESSGWNYLKNIRSCTREKLYYNDVEVWPVPFRNATWETLFDGTVKTSYIAPYLHLADLASPSPTLGYVFEEGDVIKITVNGTSNIFVAEKTASGAFYVGNYDVYNQANSDEFDGYPYFVKASMAASGTNYLFQFTSRESGTYAVTIEKEVR